MRERQYFSPARPAVFAAAVFFAMTMGACASARFTTELDSTAGVGPGDAITHGAAQIGHVVSVSPLSNGDSDIYFEVAHSNAGEIHQDSIMLLNGAGGEPSLDVVNTDPLSPAAPDGSFVSGAANQNQAQLLIQAHGVGGLANAYQQLLGPLSQSAPAQPPPSPAMAQMQSNLMQWLGQAAGANAAANPASRAQVAQAQRDFASVERQLIRQGKTAQAQQLHDQMNQLMNTMRSPHGAAPAAPGYSTP
ncbi:MAG TPA: hypothetical protein VIX12_01930 [Candidatus Binataceae bacterium]